MPTLIVHGDADDVVQIEQSKKSSLLIPNCKLEIINGSDHRFSKKEDFEKSVNLIVSFVSYHAF